MAYLMKWFRWIGEDVLVWWKRRQRRRADPALYNAVDRFTGRK